MKSALIDLAALECLNAFPRDLDRLLVVVQISPWRREALQRTFPDAAIEEAWPPGDGPWQDTVSGGLASLTVSDVTTGGVPLLECFREAWRGELERIAVANRLGDGECWVAAGSSWAELLCAMAQQGSMPLPRLAGRRPGRPAMVAEKLWTVSSRGLRLALVSRFDPTGLRRALVARSRRVEGVEAVVVSSYVNTTRAALRLWRELGAGRTLLVETGPGASAELELPPAWARTTVPGLLSACRAGVSDEIARCRSGVAEILQRWSISAGGDVPARLWSLLENGAFGSRLMTVHLPEVVVTLVALRHALEATGARLLITANEFSFCDRAALLLARAMGVRAEAVQHGVIDGHYRRDRVLADRYWCWDDAARELIVRWGAAGRSRVATLSPSDGPGARAHTQSERPTLVFFTQPYELIPLSREDLLDEVMPVLRRVSGATGWPVVIKPHPLESAALYRSRLAGLPGSRVVTDERVDSILASARAAIVLDSSVVVDCRRHGVPCFGIGWYPGHYGQDLEAMAYCRRASTPQALAAVVLGAN